MDSTRDSDSLSTGLSPVSPAITCGLCGWDDDNEDFVETWIGFIKHRGVILPVGAEAKSEQSGCLPEEAGALPASPAIKEPDGNRPV